MKRRSFSANGAQAASSSPLKHTATEQATVPPDGVSVADSRESHIDGHHRQTKIGVGGKQHKESAERTNSGTYAGANAHAQSHGNNAGGEAEGFGREFLFLSMVCNSDSPFSNADF